MPAEVTYGNYDGLRRPRVYAETRVGRCRAWRVDAAAGEERGSGGDPPALQVSGRRRGWVRGGAESGGTRLGERGVEGLQIMSGGPLRKHCRCVGRFSVSIKGEGAHYFGQDKWSPR